MLRAFLQDEIGAVSVEWTGMIAAGTGVALIGITSFESAFTSVRDGIEGRASFNDEPGQYTLLNFNTFDDDWETAWNYSGEVYEDPIFNGGPALLVRDDGLLSQSFDVPQGTDYAYIDLDLATIGQFDPTESVTVSVNGQEHRIEFGDENEAISPSDNVLIRNSDWETVDEDSQIARAQAYNGPGIDITDYSEVQDHRQHKVRLRVDNPGPTLGVELEITGATNTTSAGEAIVLDAVRVTAVETSRNTPNS